MPGGTLMVTRADNLHKFIKLRLESLGFNNITVTGAEKDGLSMLIRELKPLIVLIEGKFYDCATPYKMAELHKEFPKQNFAVVSTERIPAKRAMYFVINGAKSYVNLWEGDEQFYQGMEVIRKGDEYISPEVQEAMDNSKGSLDSSRPLTQTQVEVVRLLANGFTGLEAAHVLGISERTIDTHKQAIFKSWVIRNENELIRMAGFLGIIDPQELNFFGDNCGPLVRPHKQKNKARLKQIA